MNPEGNLHRIIIFLDHVLDNTSGIEILKAAKEIKLKFDLDMTWVLLSSTEDKNTITKYEEEGVEYFITKPLTLPKLRN